MAEIIQIDKNTWRFEDGFVRFFLLEGEERAVLIDSGVSCPDAFSLACSLTDKPVFLLNTHGDMDHTSGTGGFKDIYIHPCDYEDGKISEKYPGTSLVPLKDGEVPDLGGRPLKIIHIPGHTRGSVAVLDVTKRVLYSGDSVQKGHIYMFGPGRSPGDYGRSLDKLIAMKDGYDVIYASHDRCALPCGYAEKVKAAWEKTISGEASYETADMFGNKIKSYTLEDCGFFMGM
ncbi:MAG: MBL fold metallo-hydrolase [Oscillospiraceae bacterium]|nr:MBL fold metallo-hydrolase [Oscillospiraceae bacterium]